MIRVSRLNQEPFLINSDLIEYVEEAPHTVIYMASGRKFVVSETADQVRELIIEYRQKVVSAAFIYDAQSNHFVG